MATRKKKDKADLADLKARLGLGKSLKRKAPPKPEPVPEPTPTPQAEATPGAPPMPGQPGYVPPHVPPAFAVRKPPPPKRSRPAPDWEPPPSDVTAGTDVPIDDHGGKSRNIAFIAILAVASLLFCMVGYWAGSGAQDRAIYAAQAKDAEKVLETIKPKIAILESMSKVVLAHRGDAPNPKVLKKLENYDYILEASAIASNKLLLGPEITGRLIDFAVDTNMLAAMSRRHIRLTTKVDKQELKQLAKKAEEMKKDQRYAIIFDSKGYVKAVGKKAKTDYVPLEGKLVVFSPDAEPKVGKDGEQTVMVRYPATGKEVEMPLKNMIFVNARDLFFGGGPNALIRYASRHRAIFDKLKGIVQYMELLQEKLETLAARGSAPLFQFTSSE